MKERKIRKKEGLFSPERATPRPIDALKAEGFSGKTAKAYLRTFIPFSQFVNDVSHARKQEIEKGTSALGNFLGYKVKDLVFAIPYAIKIYSSGGTSAIGDIERGAELELAKHDIDIKDVKKAGSELKKVKAMYDEQKKKKE